MKLFVIQTVDKEKYDVYDGCVVRAENEDTALAMFNELHEGQVQDESTRENTTIAEIQIEGIPEIIHWSYNGG